jgi:hypothetical protein
MNNKLLLIVLGFALTAQMIIAQVPSYVPINGLIGYYPFNGNTNDISLNANNGVPNNVIYDTDRFGNANSCFNVNGNINRWIDVTISNLALVNQQSKTFSFWIKLPLSYTGISYYNHIITNKSTLTSSTLPYMQVYGNYSTYISGGFTNKFGFAGQTPVSNQLFNDNIWHNIIVVCDNNYNMNLYVDGLFIGTQQFSNTSDFTTLNGFRIGNNVGNLSQCAFAGQIDDIGIWNRALTQDEITSLYYSENTCQTLVINTGVLSFNPPTFNNTVTIYPNPANEQITIDCGNLANVSGWTIKIVNTLGQEVFSGAMNTQQYVVPLNSWSGQGVYFVKIYDASNNLLNTKKIILQ